MIQKDLSGLSRLSRWCFASWVTLETIARLFGAGPVHPITLADPAAKVSVTGSSGSRLPIWSADGNHLVFSSSAGNLTDDDSDVRYLQAYLRNLTNRTTELVSRNADGLPAKGNSQGLGFSSDGRYLLLESSAPDLGTPKGNDDTDVYVRDLVLGTNIPVSIRRDGLATANSPSSEPIMSEDGRYIIFVSRAMDLVEVPPDLVSLEESVLFRRDRITGSTRPLSPWPSSNSAILGTGQYVQGQTMSADGSVIAYAGIKNVPLEVGSATMVGIFVGTGAMTNFAEVPLPPGENGPLYIAFVGNLFLSGDGKYLFAECNTLREVKTNQLAGARGGILRHELATDKGEWIFRGDLAGTSSISHDGRRMAFTTQVTVDDVPYLTVNVWSEKGGVRDLTNPYIDALQFPPEAGSPVLSPDGRWLAIDSAELGNEEDGTENQLFVHLLDHSSPAEFGFQRITSTPDGSPASQSSSEHFAEFDPRSERIAFASQSPDLSPPDFNHEDDVFIHSIASKKLELISGISGGAENKMANGSSRLETDSLSGDGRWLVFSSSASNLVPGDSNAQRDVFLKDLQTGEITLISNSTNGTPSNGESTAARISRNGRIVTFMSRAPNLVGARSSSEGPAVCIYDRNTRKIRVVTETGSLRPGPRNVAGLSTDGRWILLPANSPAFNLTSLDLFDSVEGTLITNRLPRAFLPLRRTPLSFALSGNGKVVCLGPLEIPGGDPNSILIQESTGWVFSTTNWTAISVPGPSDFTLKLSHDGRRGVLMSSGAEFTLYRIELASKTATKLWSSPQTEPASLEAIDDLARWAFVRLHKGTNPTLLRIDVNSGQTQEVPIGPRDGSPSQVARWATVSADGSRVVSLNGTNKKGAILTDVWMWDFIASKGALISRTPSGSPGDLRSGNPVLSSDGSRVVFSSLATDLVPNDFQIFTDLFMANTSDFITLPPDSDQDGLPDAWERTYFVGLQISGAEDPDGDGVDTRSEYLAGTNPADPSSVLRLSVMRGATAGEWVFEFPATDAIEYFVEQASALSGPYTTATGPLKGKASSPITILTTPGEIHRWFRLRALRTP